MRSVYVATPEDVDTLPWKSDVRSACDAYLDYIENRCTSMYDARRAMQLMNKHMFGDDHFPEEGQVVSAFVISNTTPKGFKLP